MNLHDAHQRVCLDELVRSINALPNFNHTFVSQDGNQYVRIGSANLHCEFAEAGANLKQLLRPAALQYIEQTRPSAESIFDTDEAHIQLVTSWPGLFYNIQYRLFAEHAVAHMDRHFFPRFKITNDRPLTFSSDYAGGMRLSTSVDFQWASVPKIEVSGKMCKHLVVESFEDDRVLSDFLCRDVDLRRELYDRDFDIKVLTVDDRGRSSLLMRKHSGHHISCKYMIPAGSEVSFKLSAELL